MDSKPARLPTRSFRLSAGRPVAHRRSRLSDKIRVAFHIACDDGAFELAERLLGQLDQLVHCPPVLPTGVDRRQAESLAALCERLANLLLWRTEASWGGRGPIP